MNVTILSVDVKTVPTTKGSYQTADVAYKNNSFQGKVEGKKVMSFGATKDSFAVLATAQPGTSWEVQIVKNDKGYNDWVSMAPATAGAVSAAPAPTVQGSVAKPAASPKSTYETPEERAARQVLIVRQSSLSSAVAALAVGSKAALKPEDVIATAQRFEEYVFGLDKSPIAKDMSIDAMQSDEFPDVQ